MGAQISVLAPEAILGHPSACAGVGASNEASNHRLTGSLKDSSGSDLAVSGGMELNPPILRIAAVALALAAFSPGCGGSGSDTGSGASVTATPRAPRLRRDQDIALICPEVSRRASVLVGDLTQDRPPSLSMDGLRGTNFSSCRLGTRNAAIRMTLDTAPNVRTRYDNRITESQQFSSRTPGLFPHLVHGLGDRHASGGGANWLPVFNQLLSIRGSHMLAMTFYVKGVAKPALEEAAVKLARSAWGLLGVPRR